MFAKSYVWLILLLMYAPIFVLIIFSFTETKNVGAWNGFSFKLYAKLFNDKETLKALGNTILIAVSSAAVSTLLGTAGAIGIYYSRKRVRNAMEMASRIPVINPEIVIALSLILLFTTIFHINTSFFTLLVGHVVLTVPFVVLSVKPKLQQMDPNVYEAALDLGATPKYALWKVILPEILPGIFSGFLLSITLSLDDYIITAFTKGKSFQTLSTLIQSEIAKGPIPNQMRALTTIIFAVVLIGLIIVNIRATKLSGKKGA